MFKNLSNLLQKYKTASLYSSTSIIKACATMLSGFVIAKFVDPQDLGLWSTLTLILTYSVFIQGGINNGLNLELPAAYGKGDTRYAEKLAAVAQTFTLFTAGIVFIAGISFYLFYPTENQKVKYGIIGITFMVVLNFYQVYLSSTYRSNDSFLRLAKIQFFEAIFNVTSLLLVFYFAYYGMIIKSVLTLLFFVILLHLFRPIKIRITWDKTVFLHLLKVGMPIFVLILVDSTVSTVDKVWLLKYTNFTELGLYTFGLYALNLFILFGSSIASYIYPKMTFSYARTNDPLILWRYMKKITAILLLIQTPLVIIGYFIIPVLVESFFTSYILSIPVMQILLIAGMMKGSVIGVNILWSMKKWKYMYLYIITYAILLVSITFIMVHFFENKLIGISVGVLVADTINLINGIYLSYRATHEIVK